MQEALLILLLLVAIAMVVVILLQQSDGGALGIGGGPGGMMTARGAANFLTRLTAWLATIFIALALGLSIVASRTRNKETIVDKLNKAPVSTPAPSTPQVPTGN